jgi:hypothetical protein
MIVAINTRTGEYVLTDNYGEAWRRFRAHLPKASPYITCVDGSPAIRI